MAVVCLVVAVGVVLAVIAISKDLPSHFWVVSSSTDPTRKNPPPGA